MVVGNLQIRRDMPAITWARANRIYEYRESRRSSRLIEAHRLGRLPAHDRPIADHSGAAEYGSALLNIIAAGSVASASVPE